MAFTIGIKLSTTDSDGKAFTSAPVYIDANDHAAMTSIATEAQQALQRLSDLGLLDSYSIVLKRETVQAAPGAGP